AEVPDNKLFQALGERIRELRTQKGFSQERFAERCGIHRTFQGHLERGEKNASLMTLVRVAEALNVTLSDLFSGLEQRAKQTDQSPPGARPRKYSGAVSGKPVDVVRLLEELQLDRQLL